MTRWEKVALAISTIAGLGLVGTVFSVGRSWENIDNRFRNVERQLNELKKANGTTSCNLIIQRQVAAIEKRASAEVKDALAELAITYDCEGTLVMTGSRRQVGLSNIKDWMIASEGPELVAEMPPTPALKHELRRIDREIGEQQDL